MALLAIGALAGCAQEHTLPPASLRPVKVGLVTSLTGDLASLGQGWVNAALIAEQEANAAGGVLPGRPVELVVQDDQTDPAVGEMVARRLVEEEGTVAILGAAASSVTLRVATVTGPAEVPQVSCCSTSPDLTTAQPRTARFLFRTVPSDLLQASVLATAARDTFSCTRLAVMHLDDEYGTPFGAAVADKFGGAGGTVTSQVAFTSGRASYNDEVNEVIATSPDCVALVAFPESAGAILNDWSSNGGPDVTWIGTDGVKTDGFVMAVGDPSLIDGFRGTAPSEPTGGAREAFLARYRTTFGDDPVIFGASQYDAAALLVLAMARAGSSDGISIRDSLFEVSNPNPDPGAPPDQLVEPGELGVGIGEIRSGGTVDYNGAGGPVDLDADGNVRADYEIWRYDAASDTFVTEDTIRAQDINP